LNPTTIFFIFSFLRATLDEDLHPGSTKNRAILLDESPTPKSDKSRLDLHDSILAGKSIGSNQKKS
jgi:hypothetical protein